MAVYDSFNVSTFDFKNIPNYAEFSINEQKVDPFNTSKSVESIEFEPIFPVCLFDIPSISNNQPQPIKQTKELTHKSLYEDFRVPSAWREYRVTAHDQAGSAIFYINLEEICEISKVLFQKITTVTKTRRGQVYGPGEITVGIWEFEVLLRLICDSYEGVARTTAIAKYMKRMLVLAARYEIPSLIEECKMVVLNANLANVDSPFVQRWFEAFEDTKLDEIRNNCGNVVARTIRSHIISEMSRLNKWHELFHFLPQTYWAPIRYRMQFGQTIFSAYEVDHLILGFDAVSGYVGFAQQVSPPYYYY